MYQAYFFKIQLKYILCIVLYFIQLNSYRMGNSEHFCLQTCRRKCIKNKKQNSNEQDNQSILEDVQQQIMKNQRYHQLLSKNILSKIREQNKQFYFNQQQELQLLNFYKTYIQINLNKSSEKRLSQINLFCQKLGTKLLRIETDVFFSNLNSLLVLQMIIQNKILLEKADLKDFEHISHVFTFFFNYPCQRDINCFALLYLYIGKCCKNYQNQGKSIQQISELLKNTLQKLAEKYPAAPPLDDDPILYEIKSWKADNIQKIQPELDISNIENVKKKQALMEFLEVQINQADKNRQKFIELIKEPCLKNGSHLLIGTKVKNIKDEKGLNRVIEKIFKKDLYNKKKQKDETKLKATNLSEFYRQQRELFDNDLKSIIENKERVTFSITDMLRGKCLYDQIDDINQCVLDLKKIIEEKGQEYELIEIDNRFKSITNTSDIVLKIRIGKTITELQLAIKFNQIQNSFSHKIYEIMRSQYYEWVNFLHLYNETVCRSYLDNISNTIKHNNSNSTKQKQLQIYQNTHKKQFKTFYQLQADWKQLYRFLKTENTTSSQAQPHSRNIRVNILTSNQTKNIPKKVKINERQYYYANGVFLAAKMKHKQSICMLQKYINYINETDYLMLLGHEYSKIGDNNNSIDRYKKCLDIQQRQKSEKLTDEDQTLFCIGVIYFNQGDYPSTLKYYLKCLEIEQKFKGKGSFETASTLNNLGLVCLRQQNYIYAMKYFEQSLEIVQRVKGKGFIQTAQIFNNIGLVYFRQANLKKALKNYQISLEIKERAKGKGSIDTASNLSNIGLIYQRQGNYSQALKYYYRSLEIQQRVKGKGSIDTAKTINDIGMLYKHQGNYQQALKYCKLSLEITQRVYGRESIQNTIILKSMGSIYFQKANYPQALKNYQQCLEIQERIKGKLSIDAAQTLTLIGVIYKKQGNYSIALSYFQKSLEIQQRIKGKGSLDTVLNLSNIGQIYFNQANYSQALKYYKLCQEIQYKFKGEEAIGTQVYHDHIGSIYFKQENYQEALTYFQKSLEIQQRVNDKESIGMSTTFNFIAMVYQKQGDNPQAIKYYEKSLDIIQKIKGKGSSDTSANLNSLGMIHLTQGNYSKAHQYFQQVLEIQQKFKGKGSIDTTFTLINIGLTYFNQAKYSKAHDYFRESLQIQQKFKGKGSIDTLIILNILGQIQQKQGNHDQAIKYYQQCLQIQQKVYGEGSIETVQILQTVGKAYIQLKQYKKASQYIDRAYYIMIKSYGFQHQKTTANRQLADKINSML